MASLSNLVCCTTRFSSNEDYHQKNNPYRLLNGKVKGISGLFTAKDNQFNTTRKKPIETRDVIKVENDCVHKGVLFDEIKYKQTYVIRSSEVGHDKTATFESILNLIQETGLNHAATMEIFCDEYGATHEMALNNLIWVVSRMQIEMNHYPKWGEKIDIHTWYAPSTKTSFLRESLVRNTATGLILARATSTLVLMNPTTKRLVKIPDATRATISPWLINEPLISQMKEKIEKLDSDRAEYVISNFKPRISDLDMNYHVHNIKYIRWIMEVIPNQVLERHKLSTMVLEYRKECGSSDIVESLCEQHGEELETGQLTYTHLLQIENEIKTEEILRGRTTWKRNIFAPSFLQH